MKEDTGTNGYNNSNIDKSDGEQYRTFNRYRMLGSQSDQKSSRKREIEGHSERKKNKKRIKDEY